MERMVLMSEGEILRVQDLPEEIRAASAALFTVGADGIPEEEGNSLKEIVRRRTQTLEKELIEQALAETGGNVTRASAKLGLSRKGLQLKMKELGVRRAE
jgi:DNA-binding NtrC family response regulator